MNLFRKYKTSKSLYSTGHEFFLGYLDLDGEMVDKLLDLMIAQNTPWGVLQVLLNKRVGEAIFASYDLTPIIESVLCIVQKKDTWKTLSSNTNSK